MRLRKLLLATSAASAALVALPIPAAHADARQVGGRVTAEGYYATGIRTRIFMPPLPQFEATGVANYEWIGSYLAQGDFLQVGWAPLTSCSTDIAYFYEYFYPSGTTGGPVTFCAPSTPTADTFTFQITSTSGGYTWTAYHGSYALPYSSFITGSSSTGTNGPYAVTETTQNAAGLPATTNDMGPSTYHSAITVKVNGVWADTPHAIAYRLNTPCSYGSVIASAVQQMGAGEGITGCPADGDSLW